MNKNELLKNLCRHEVEQIEVPEWQDGEEPAIIHIRTLSGAQREEIEDIIVKNKVKSLRALVFIHSVCDVDGNLMFDKADMAALNEGDGKVLDRVFHAAVKLNRMSDTDIADAKKN